MDEDTWRRAWDLKVFGYINLTRAVYAAMKKKGTGVIVNILGNAGERLNAAYIAGSTANAGLMAFTRTLGGASHADGIRVLGINPGPGRHRPADQPVQADGADEARRRQSLPGTVQGDVLRPSRRRAEEIASTVAFLASERSAYTTGCILTIDGGLAARWT